MNDETKLDGTLCADEENPAVVEAQPVAGSAPAEGKKEYVPPRMQVIPLGPQRLLATSGVSGDPVQVFIRGGLCIYKETVAAQCLPQHGGITVDDLLHSSPSFSRFTSSGYMFGIEEAKYTNLCYYKHEMCDKDKSWGPEVSFGPGGEGWAPTDFLANVALDTDGVFISGSASGYNDVRMVMGEYNGVPVEVWMTLEITTDRS